MLGLIEEINMRILHCRERMQKESIDYLYIPLSDPHLSEYVPERFQIISYLTGFTGSNAKLLLGMTDGYLWTDGRYYEQAARQLQGTGLILMKSMEPGVKSIYEWIETHLHGGQRVLIPSSMISIKDGRDFCASADRSAIHLVDVLDLWEWLALDGPPMIWNDIFIYPQQYHGEPASAKLAQIRKDMLLQEADTMIFAKLDEIMWILNIRGQDILYNPVAVSYLIVQREAAYFYTGCSTLSKDVQEYLGELGVEICPYHRFMKDLLEMDLGKKAMFTESAVNYASERIVASRVPVHFAPSMVSLRKACKNETELQGIKQVYRKDSLLFTKFMYALDQREDWGDEASLARELDALRLSDAQCIGLSFATICAYGKNASMMHYQASKESSAKILPEGMLLVDSGGQYLGGTTDLTRMLICGDLSLHMKEDYTDVLRGMLRLMNTIFPVGCSGRNLDAIARQYLWSRRIDYLCGTGHGIGNCLNVHEGPQSISWRRKPEDEVALCPGMILSNEPGVYMEEQYGIRIENIMYVDYDRDGEGKIDNQYLRFYPLTLVPIDRSPILYERMDMTEREMLANYHQLIYSSLHSELSQDERDWYRSHFM